MPAAALPSDLSASHDLLHALLDVSLPGVILFRPVYAADDPAAIIDLAYVHLNPAAQQMLRLPAQPPETFRTLYPNALETGIFAFYRDTFLSGQPGDYAVNYPYEELNNFFLLTARRSGELLVVGFTDTAAQERSQVEQALRESQAREQAARAEAEVQRQRFYDVLVQLPAQVATYHGPNHVFTFVNPRFSAFVPSQGLLGRPVREASQGAVGQQVFTLLDRVYTTGEPVHLPELEVVLDHPDDAPTAKPLFVNATYLPLHDGEGHIYGVLDFSYEVTELVLARRQVEQLNQELETRVQARTRELDDQQRLLGQILAQVPAAITTLRGPDHRFAFANDRYQQLVEGRVVVGQTVAETLPEVVEQGFVELLDNVYRTGQNFEGKGIAILLAPPGQPPVQHYLDFTYQPMPDEHGQTQGLLVFAVDVTEQVRARRQAEALQAELLATAQRQALEREAFHNVFEQTPALVALLRAPGHRFEYVNPAYQALFSKPLVGLEAAVAAPELVAQGFVALLDHVCKTGETYFGEDVPFTTAATDDQPAHTVYFNFTYQAYREDGQIAGISIFAFDVTEQVLARQEREQQRQQLHDLFMQAPAAISILAGPELAYEFVNPNYQQLFPNRPLLGKPLLEALPELRASPTWDTLQQVYRTGQNHVDQSVRIPLARLQDGALEDIYFSYVFQARTDTQGRSDGVVVFAFDITEQVQARQQVQDLNEELAAINEELTATNEELNESNTQLTRTNVDLDTFVYTASHDLKAPITNIEGILNALRAQLSAEVQQDETVAQLLDMLQGTVTRFQLTITQLTDITKLQLAHTGPAELVQLAPVVKSVRLDLASLIDTAATALTVDVAPDLVVSFSPANLRSIVYNLLSNAVKYRSAERSSHVWLRATYTPQAVVLTVQDNGLGMSEAQQRQLFGLFQRLHTHVEGTGVGLYIVKRLVENGGGTITVQSRPDVGTTFTVTFPLPRA